MKKVFSCLLAVLMIASMLIVSVGAMVGPEFHDYGDIANVSRKAIRLDGDREDAYDAAEAIEITTFENEAKTSPANGTAWWVYDTEFIWIFVEVNDTTLNTKAPGALESSYKEDSVEIVIDWGNSGTDVSGETPYQARVTHEGYISGRIGSKNTPETSMFGSKLDGGPNPVNWLEGYGKHKEDGSGYVVEFKIEIPADKFDIGEHISMMMMINDYDETGALGTRVMIVSGPNPLANQWKVQNAGYIGFDYAPYTADMTIIYVAIAMVAALAIGGVALISLKKKAK